MWNAVPRGSFARSKLTQQLKRPLLWWQSINSFPSMGSNRIVTGSSAGCSILSRIGFSLLDGKIRSEVGDLSLYWVRSEALLTKSNIDVDVGAVLFSLVESSSAALGFLSTLPKANSSRSRWRS